MKPDDGSRFQRELRGDFSEVDADLELQWERIKLFVLGALVIALLCLATVAMAGEPFAGTPIQINGTPAAVTIIEAENFDKGGEGVAYHDPHSCSAPPAGTTCSCPPGAYRPDGVNVCALNAVNYVSFMDNGLWAEYTVQVDTTGNYTVELLTAAAAAAPAVSLTVEGAPNLPLSGVSTRVTVGFISGTPTLVELSRDGMPPFAVWPAGANSTSWLLASDKKSVSRDWCISAGCWGNVPGPHVLTVKASYGTTWGPSTASVAVNVSDTVPPSSGAQIAGACCATPAYHIELDGKRYPENGGSYELGTTAGWNSYEWRGKSDAIPMVPGIHKLRVVVDQHWFNWDAIRVTFAKGIEWQWVPVWKEYVK